MLDADIVTNGFYEEEEEEEEIEIDSAQIRAEKFVLDIFENSRSDVFFSRQIEVLLEREFFHWITNRAIKSLIVQRKILSETRKTKHKSTVNLLWHPSFRYYKRRSNEVIKLIEKYSEPDFGHALGYHSESLVIEAFARFQFRLLGREQKKFNDLVWSETGHDLDFIYEREGVVYGVEVKNTLGYMSHREFQAKISMCQFFGIRPVFVVRVVPASWVIEIQNVGGFILMLKYQLYPFTHKSLAKEISSAFGFPIDCPRSLWDSTMQRFLKYHEKCVN